MSEAIFGLVGVVVGGVLTGLVTVWLDGRHEASEGRVARRIARSEVDQAQQAITEARKGDWPAGWRPTWSQSCAAYRRPLAATASDPDFAAIAAAYGSMQLLESGLLSGRRAIDDADRKFFDDVEQSLRTAKEQLG